MQFKIGDHVEASHGNTYIVIEVFDTWMRVRRLKGGAEFGPTRQVKITNWRKVGA